MSLLVALLLAQGTVLREPVTDQAGVLSAADRQALTSELRALEASDSTQVWLLTVPSTAPRSIETYALETARASGIGQAGRDNGVLVVVATKDRKVRIEVGRGLEGRLPDSVCGTIIRAEMAPRFQQGDFPGGIKGGISAIIAVVRGEYVASPPPGRQRMDPKMTGLVIGLVIVALICRALGAAWLPFLIAPGWAGLGWWLFAFPFGAAIAGAYLITAVAVLGRGGRRRHGWGYHGSSWSSGSLWSSGSSGSSGGGWSGGGGGSFGGGGASGSW